MLGRFWDANAARVLFTALIFAAVLAFIWAARGTLTLFLFSILFAYFLEPLVGRLESPLRGRGRAIAAVYLIIGGVVAGLLIAFGPQMTEQARSLVKTLPSLGDEMGSGRSFHSLVKSTDGQRRGRRNCRDFFWPIAAICCGLRAPWAQSWWSLCGTSGGWF
jgi:predicted PurR-regulated permease PerM